MEGYVRSSLISTEQRLRTLMIGGAPAWSRRLRRIEETQDHAGRASRRTKPVVCGTWAMVEVERPPRQTRIPEQLRLWWRGPRTPGLAVLWRAYGHRFDSEHPDRFCKRTLNWTHPRVGPSSRRIDGPGWCCWPTPSSVWLAAPARIGASRENGPSGPIAPPRTPV